ncbi:MAG: hypothetical protein OEW75_17735, partial [Cyclobacteriaceae bacterium]|nr:hypothetical protein [Cyclobacteriaceae bacterium]
MDFRFKVILSGILVSALVLIILSISMMKSLRSEVLNHAESRLNIEALSRNHNLSEIFSEKAIVLSQSARLV